MGSARRPVLPMTLPPRLCNAGASESASDDPLASTASQHFTTDPGHRRWCSKQRLPSALYPDYCIERIQMALKGLFGFHRLPSIAPKLAPFLFLPLTSSKLGYRFESHPGGGHRDRFPGQLLGQQHPDVPGSPAAGLGIRHGLAVCAPACFIWRTASGRL